MCPASSNSTDLLYATLATSTYQLGCVVATMFLGDPDLLADAAAMARLPPPLQHMITNMMSTDPAKQLNPDLRRAHFVFWDKNPDKKAGLLHRMGKHVEIHAESYEPHKSGNKVGQQLDAVNRLEALVSNFCCWEACIACSTVQFATACSASSNRAAESVMHRMNSCSTMLYPARVSYCVTQAAYTYQQQVPCCQPCCNNPPISFAMPQGAENITALPGGKTVSDMLEYHTPATKDNGSFRAMGKHDMSKPDSWSLSKLCLGSSHLFEHYADKLSEDVLKLLN
jgi:hypothetical protein